MGTFWRRRQLDWIYCTPRWHPGKCRRYPICEWRRWSFILDIVSLLSRDSVEQTVDLHYKQCRTNWPV